MENFFVLPNEVVREGDMPSSERLVYIYLLCIAGSNGVCFPSVKTISKELRLSRSTVCRCIQSLNDKKIIRYIRRISAAGGYMSNFYLVANRCYNHDEEKLDLFRRIYLSGLINSPESVNIDTGDENGKD